MKRLSVGKGQMNIPFGVFSSIRGNRPNQKIKDLGTKITVVVTEKKEVTMTDSGFVDGHGEKGNRGYRYTMVLQGEEHSFLTFNKKYYSKIDVNTTYDLEINVIYVKGGERIPLLKIAEHPVHSIEDIGAFIHDRVKEYLAL